MPIEQHIQSLGVICYSSLTDYNQTANITKIPYDRIVLEKSNMCHYFIYIP